jgi:2-keto-4-pentenoate hydratase/2-oxohepta-3-ene-1,7-dioic acid hydratase in catechol pathway
MEEPIMRIVRFAEAIDLPWVGDFPDGDVFASEEFSEALDETDIFGETLLDELFEDAYEDDSSGVRWGMIVDDLVYPLAQAPYLTQSLEGVYLPEVAGSPLPLSDVQLYAPVEPSKIICVGRNYAAHAAELGNEVPTEPLIFLKPPTVVIGPGEEVISPSISERVDYEGELAIVIGRECRHLEEDDAASVIFGYTVANDVTARDLQKQDGQWTRGKGFDTFGPMGPWLDTKFNPRGRAIQTRVNNEVRQESNIDLLIYPIGRILAHISRFMTLLPGDVILTGTPDGVGPVEPGDVMTVEIEGLGTLSNPVVAEPEIRRRIGDAF